MEDFDEYPTPVYKLAKSFVPNNEKFKSKFDFYINTIRRKVNKKFIVREPRKYVEGLNEEIYDILFIHQCNIDMEKLQKNVKNGLKIII